MAGPASTGHGVHLHRGLGSFLSTTDRVWPTAGLTRSVSGFGYTPRKSSSAISGATTTSSRTRRSGILRTSSCTGPVIVRW